MFVKLKDNFINLDLIKKVSDVKVYYALKTDFEEGDVVFYSEITSSEKEARLLNQTINGSEQQRKYVVVYGFEITYLNEEEGERISIGTDRIEARKYLEAFIQFLNSNVSSIPEIKM